jgi:hypothetical protein
MSRSSYGFDESEYPYLEPVEIARWTPTLSLPFAGFDVSITGYVAITSIAKTI